MAGRTVSLIVDDDGEIVSGLWELLHRSIPEMVVIGVSSVEEALKGLKALTPAVVVADQYMPRMNGIEFLRRAREHAPDALRVLCSALMTPELEQEATRNGIHLVWKKPFDVDGLVGTFRRVHEAVVRGEKARTVVEETPLRS